MSASDFFALCLAHRLDDKDSATHYASLVSQVGQGSLLVAYTRAKKHQGGGESLSKRFHLELEHIRGGSIDAPGNLLSIRIERRTIAAAVFIGTRLDFTNSRELSSNPAKAEASTIGFLDWLVQNVQCESAALELETEFEIRRGALNACAQKLLRGARRFTLGSLKARSSSKVWASTAEKPQRTSPDRTVGLAGSGSSQNWNSRRHCTWPVRANRTSLYQLTLLLMIGPLPYIGGKNRLATEIISLLPEHTTYVEPFAGGAQVLFHKQPSRVEVINDLDFDIVNFFRVCQLHSEELVRYLRFTLVSRAWHSLYAAEDADSLTDVQRAARFFYLQKNSFGGLVLEQKFHYGVTHPSNYNPERIPEILEKTHQRLQRVQIESLPYEQVLQKYDRPTTLFYVDPPYFGRRLYRHNLGAEDFVILAEHLRKLRGNFVLSLNDLPEVRSIFADFRIQSTDLIYTAKTNPTSHRELLIMNFNQEKRL